MFFPKEKAKRMAPTFKSRITPCDARGSGRLNLNNPSFEFHQRYESPAQPRLRQFLNQMSKQAAELPNFIIHGPEIRATWPSTSHQLPIPCNEQKKQRFPTLEKGISDRESTRAARSEAFGQRFFLSPSLSPSSSSSLRSSTV